MENFKFLDNNSPNLLNRKGSSVSSRNEFNRSNTNINQLNTDKLAEDIISKIINS